MAIKLLAWLTERHSLTITLGTTVGFTFSLSCRILNAALAHIATVGKAMSSSEEVAYPILRKHDVDYVLVIFGGLLGYSGDDINKFLWMVRIAQGVWPDEIQEPNYCGTCSHCNRNGNRFAELFGGGQAVDRVRQQNLPKNGPTLDILGMWPFSPVGDEFLTNVNIEDEAYTSENWIVRIYQVRKEDNLGRDHKTANTFAQGKKRKRSKPQSRRRAMA